MGSPLGEKEELALYQELKAGNMSERRELDIYKALQSRTSLAEVTGTQTGAIMDAEEADPGFIDRVGDSWDSRREEVATTFEDFANNDINAAQAVVQTVGKGVAGPALDVLGEGLQSAWEGVKWVTPDDVEDAVSERFSRTWDIVSNTEVGNVIGLAIKDGADGWNNFKQDNPQTAKDIESVANIAMVFAPAKTKAKVDPITAPVPKPKGPIAAAARYMDRLAGKQAKSRKAAYIDDLVQPEATKAVKIERASRTTDKGKVIMTTQEKEVAREVQKIKGVSSKKSIQQNLNAINQHNTVLAKQLDKKLANAGTLVDKQQVIRELDTQIAKLTVDHPMIVGDAQKVAERIMKKAEQIILDSKTKPNGRGLLQARKDLDNWVRTQKGQGVFEPTTHNAAAVAVRAIRDTINNQIAASAPNVQVKSLLKRQSLLYRASENIAPKAAAEANTALGRLVQNAVSVIPIRNKVMQELAVISGTTIFGATSIFAPAFSMAVVGAGLAYGGLKVITSPKAKSAIANILKLTDTAIKSSTNPKMIRQLRADRALIVELLGEDED